MGASMRLGRLLARYREAAGIAQAEAARLAGVDRSHLSRVESGRERRVPSGDLIDRLARLYRLAKDKRQELHRLRTAELSRG